MSGFVDGLTGTSDNGRFKGIFHKDYTTFALPHKVEEIVGEGCAGKTVTILAHIVNLALIPVISAIKILAAIILGCKSLAQGNLSLRGAFVVIPGVIVRSLIDATIIGALIMHVADEVVLRPKHTYS